MNSSAAAIFAARSISSSVAVGMAEGDIRGDRVAEQEIVLKHDADISPQVVDVEAADVDPVELHAPLLDVVIPRNEIQQARLAGAGFPNDGHALAGRDLEAQVLEDRLTRFVRELHVIESNPPLRSVDSNGMRRAEDFDRRVEHLEDALSAGQAALNAVGDIRDLANLVGEFIKQVRKDEQARAERQLAVDDQITAVAQEHDHVDLGQKAHQRLKQAQLVEDVEFLIADLPVGRRELGDFLRLAGKALHDRDALHVLDEREHHAVDQFAALHVGGLHDPREPGRSPP